MSSDSRYPQPYVQWLTEALKPGAPVHEDRDSALLKVYVQEVEVLVNGLPCAGELAEDRLGIKGIVAKTPQQKKGIYAEGATEDLAYYDSQSIVVTSEDGVFP